MTDYFYAKKYLILLLLIVIGCKKESLELDKISRIEFYEFKSKKIENVNKNDLLDYKQLNFPPKFKAEGFYTFYYKDGRIKDSIRAGKDIFGSINGRFYCKPSSPAFSDDLLK